jgi:hypothetical protein
MVGGVANRSLVLGPWGLARQQELQLVKACTVVYGTVSSSRINL